MISRPSQHALTIIEIMVAVSLASFIAAIGFTGVNAYGKAITRSKQFTAETEIILAAMRSAVKSADQNGADVINDINPAAVPPNWPEPTIAGNMLTFEVKIAKNRMGGNIDSALKTDSSRKNSMIIKALMAYR